MLYLTHFQIKNLHFSQLFFTKLMFFQFLNITPVPLIFLTIFHLQMHFNETITAKNEISHNEQLFLWPQCFQLFSSTILIWRGLYFCLILLKSSAAECCMWERVIKADNSEKFIWSQHLMVTVNWFNLPRVKVIFHSLRCFGFTMMKSEIVKEEISYILKYQTPFICDRL